MPANYYITTKSDHHNFLKAFNKENNTNSKKSVLQLQSIGVAEIRNELNTVLMDYIGQPYLGHQSILAQW